MKEISRLKTEHGDLVCYEIKDKSYPGFFVYLERDAEVTLVSTVEVQNDPETKHAGTIVCSYVPDKDDPVYVGREPMESYDKYFFQEDHTADVFPVHEIIEPCPFCMNDLYIKTEDPQYAMHNRYTAVCTSCGKQIMLCDECLHSKDNTDMNCDWCPGKNCFRNRDRKMQE